MKRVGLAAALETLGAAYRARRAAVDAVPELVVAARAAGATVADIAATLGRPQSHVSRTYRTQFAAIPTPSKADGVAGAREALDTLAAAVATVPTTEDAELSAVAAVLNAGGTWRQVAEQTGSDPTRAQANRGNVIATYQPYLEQVGGKWRVCPNPPGRLAKATTKSARGRRLTATAQTQLVTVQVQQYGPLMPPLLQRAAQLRMQHPDLSGSQLAAVAGIPAATLQHQLERVLAYRPSRAAPPAARSSATVGQETAT